MTCDQSSASLSNNDFEIKNESLFVDLQNLNDDSLFYVMIKKYLSNGVRC